MNQTLKVLLFSILILAMTSQSLAAPKKKAKPAAECNTDMELGDSADDLLKEIKEDKILDSSLNELAFLMADYQKLASEETASEVLRSTIAKKSQELHDALVKGGYSPEKIEVVKTVLNKKIKEFDTDLATRDKAQTDAEKEARKRERKMFDVLSPDTSSFAKNLGTLTFPKPKKQEASIDWTPDGKYILVSSELTATLIDAKTLNIEKQIKATDSHKEYFEKFHITPDGQIALSTSKGVYRISVDKALNVKGASFFLNKDKYSALELDPTEHGAITPAFGDHFLVEDKDHYYRRLGPKKSSKPVMYGPNESYETSGAAVSPDGKYALVDHKDFISIYDFETGKHLRDLGENDERFEDYSKHKYRFSPDGKTLLVVALDWMATWTLDEGKLVSFMEFKDSDKVHENDFFDDAVWSADGRFFVVIIRSLVDEDGFPDEDKDIKKTFLQVWYREGTKPVQSLPLPDIAQSLKFNPTGQTLTVLGKDKKTKELKVHSFKFDGAD